MKIATKLGMNLGLMSLSLALAMPGAFAAKVGEPAPAFTGLDANGKTVELSQYKGKYVVLEWHNKQCPYVKTQYASGNMQKAQKDWTSKGVIWLSVVSSAPGGEGSVDAKAAKADIKDTHQSVTAMILDTNGTIGHAYDAKTTPHMFVIDPKGTLIYNGAIDDSKNHDASDVNAKTTNYVSLALNESMAGTPVSHPTTKPFGCSVKY
jgi:peroxiredoxin